MDCEDKMATLNETTPNSQNTTPGQVFHCRWQHEDILKYSFHASFPLNQWIKHQCNYCVIHAGVAIRNPRGARSWLRVFWCCASSAVLGYVHRTDIVRFDYPRFFIAQSDFVVKKVNPVVVKRPINGDVCVKNSSRIQLVHSGLENRMTVDCWTNGNKMNIREIRSTRIR